MKVVADLHLHSKYSRAVSKKMEPEIMAEWAAKKGIDLLGTSDWTHPLWLKELESKLEEAGEGIFQLRSPVRGSSTSPRNSLRSVSRLEVRSATNSRSPKVFFALSTEISSIYSQGGKGRRIHNLVLAPSFKTVHKINKELKKKRL